MQWKDSDLITPVSLGIIEDQKSYWANHFYSIIECIDSHKNLRHSPRRFDTYPVWSLSQMRGNLPLNFFREIQDYMCNWGFQYFLVNYLNQKNSGEVVSELLSRLSDLYDCNFNSSLNEYSFHISGADSSLSKNLRSRFTDFFPPEIKNNPPREKSLIDESDLCLIIHEEDSDYKVGIFGEIEGVHGQKMRRSSYWEKKQDYCVFSFGVTDGNTKECYVENTYLDGVDRVSFHFEQENYIVQDFRHALGWIEQLFLHGPHYGQSTRDEEFDFFVNVLKKFWNKQISELLRELSRFIDGSDLVGKKQGKTINIITDIRA